jgi:hypothetical protein
MIQPTLNPTDLLTGDYYNDPDLNMIALKHHEDPEHTYSEFRKLPEYTVQHHLFFQDIEQDVFYILIHEYEHSIINLDYHDQHTYLQHDALYEKIQHNYSMEKWYPDDENGILTRTFIFRIHPIILTPSLFIKDKQDKPFPYYYFNSKDLADDVKQQAIGKRIYEHIPDSPREDEQELQ